MKKEKRYRLFAGREKREGIPIPVWVCELDWSNRSSGEGTFGLGHDGYAGMDKGGIYSHKSRANFFIFSLAYFEVQCYIHVQEMLHRAFLPGRLGRFDRADPLARWVYSQPYCKSFRTGGLFGRLLGVCWNGSPDGIFQ